MLTCASFFAGVGGIDLGFSMAGFKTIYANEFNTYAAETLGLNYDIEVDTRDIRAVEVKDIPNFEIMLAGFPCQAFSVAGYQQGFKDEKGRGDLFFELVRIAREKMPRVVFLENVKNLVNHNNGDTFKVICEELSALGYKYAYKVMNTCDYGNIPQNRERIYIIAFRFEDDFNRFIMPAPIPLTKTIEEVIFFGETQADKYYYTPEKCKFYDELKREINNNNTIYQWRRVYVRENKKGLIPTLTANMGGGGHNVPLILTNDKKIRKLTPRECFNAQGFPSTFALPQQSDTQLYKQAGNSVSVPVVMRIAEAINIALKERP